MKFNRLGVHLFTGPECAVCGREVDEFHEHRDPVRCELVLVVRCHGAEERVVLEAEVVAGERIRFGKAFATPARAALPEGG